MVAIGDLMKVTRTDIQDFPGDTIDLIIDLQKEGWRAQRSNRNHVMLFAPDGVTKYSASRNASSAKYLREDIARYKRGDKILTEDELKEIMDKEAVHDHDLKPYGDEGRYRCTICGGNTFTEADLPASQKFPCPHAGCQKFYTSQVKLNVHIAVDHEGYLKCPDCDEVRINERLLSIHRSRSHGYESPRKAQRKAQEANRAAKKIKGETPLTPEVIEELRGGPVDLEKVHTIEFTQHNVAPQALDPEEVADQTRAQLAVIRGSAQSTEVVRTEDDLEFIDSRDSWVINHELLSRKRIRELEEMFGASGLLMEIRVWKPK